MPFQTSMCDIYTLYQNLEFLGKNCSNFLCMIFIHESRQEMSLISTSRSNFLHMIFILKRAIREKNKTSVLTFYV